ncbi:helix-turn-helix transcriptional regulator [Microbispora rosea]|uniref:helix-turn-helix transcriptional regulator n=1 Tax=Microbispora rosea TaxID=58117 RepID=UPI0037B16D0D
MREHELLSRPAVALRLGVCERTLERWAKRGIGPSPVRLGPRLVRYLSNEVDAWLTESTGRRSA